MVRHAVLLILSSNHIVAEMVEVEARVPALALEDLDLSGQALRMLPLAAQSIRSPRGGACRWGCRRLLAFHLAHL